MCNDILWHIREFQSHVFVSGHWRAQIKILDIHHEESCTWHQYYAVDEQLDGK
jgi:hypothetical protein